MNPLLARLERLEASRRSGPAPLSLGWIEEGDTPEMIAANEEEMRRIYPGRRIIMLRWTPVGTAVDWRRSGGTEPEFRG